MSWARKRAGYSLEEAQAKFPKIADWEDPQSLTFPTYAQLETLSDAFKVPIAVFFFPSPPDVPPIEQTFRTLPETELMHMGPRVRLLLRKAKSYQISLNELSNGRNPSPRLITRDLQFPLNISADKMAEDVRNYLGITLEQQTEWSNDEEALKGWRSAFSEAGIFVFKDAFKADRFAGFCLTDPEFPIIYVNNTTRPFARQIFTLFHELGHLLLQTSGIDYRADEPLAPTADARRIEVLCNRFASAFLVPDRAFRLLMRGRVADLNTARELANYFKVSTLVIFGKFLHNRLIDQATYQEAYEASQGRMAGQGSGGDYYNNQLAYLGRDYISLALAAYHQQRISESQLAEHLNIPVKQIAPLEMKFLGGAA